MRPIEFIQSIDRAIVAEDMKQSHAHDPYSPMGDLSIKHLQEETLHKQTSVNQTEAQDQIHPDDKKKESRERRPGTSKTEKGLESNTPSESKEPDKGSHLDMLG